MQPVFSNYIGFSSDFKLRDVPKKPLPFYHEAFCGDTYPGQGITVAVLDSAINVNHSVFQDDGDTRLTGRNFVNEKEDFWRTNREAHGTMVAGIVASVAKKASIHLCCVRDKEKYTGVREALNHLIDRVNGGESLDIVVMSFGQDAKENPDRYLDKISQLHDKGVLCIAAAGNGGPWQSQVANPACLPNVIAVGSLCALGTNVGKPSSFNPMETTMINAYAPGEGVCCPVCYDNDEWKWCDGTSCSAPAIAGFIARLLDFIHQKSPELKVNICDIEMCKKILSSESSPFTFYTGNESFVLNPNRAFLDDTLIDQLRDFINA